MDLLRWKNKQESATIFISLNLAFYLIVLGDYSILSLLSYICIVFIIIMNIHNFLCKPKYVEDDYLYLKRETLDEIFVFFYEIAHKTCEKIHRSVGDSIQAILGLVILNWFVQFFGTAGLMWICCLMVFGLTPQYYANKEMVDDQIKALKEKVVQTKNTVFELIPKHSKNN